jgi:mono/diheme cytochrome c family protein
MTRSRPLLALCALLASAAPLGQESTSLADGKAVFDKWCTPCHGSAVTTDGLFGGGPLPGTAALAVKYKGELPPVLEDRTDLTAAYIRTVVRGGLFGMPISRKTEISDADLDNLIAYLRRNATDD